MLYIGIDLGTSAVKLLLMDSQGNICNIVSGIPLCISCILAGRNRILRTGMNRPWRASEELLKDADKNQVAGISFGGQMHGLVILTRRIR